MSRSVSRWYDNCIKLALYSLLLCIFSYEDLPLCCVCVHVYVYMGMCFCGMSTSGCSKIPDQYVPVGDTCYRFMCANCGMGVPFFEFREKIWPYVLLLTLFNLMVHPIIGMNMKRRFFNIHEIFAMMDQYWDSLCAGRERTKTWYIYIYDHTYTSPTQSLLLCHFLMIYAIILIKIIPISVIFCRWRTANAVLSTRRDLFVASSTFSNVRSYYALRDPRATFVAFRM
jgi:hypothetical protein